MFASVVCATPWRYTSSDAGLYSVEDALRFVVGHKKDAVVVYFLGRPADTAHAVMRLNRQGGGRR
jgi:adenine-specific DNA-methyltransferase